MKEEAAASRGDDFKKISGIGPAIERRLHDTGILTYAQLAALSPAELAERLQDFTGMSAARVEQQGWVESARELASATVLQADKPANAPGNGQHYATFSIELLLDDKNEVRRTRSVYIQGREESSWAGWDRQRLIGFVELHAEIRMEAAEAAAVGPAPEAETASAEEAAAKAGGPAEAARAEEARATRRAAKPAPPPAGMRSSLDVGERQALREEPVDLRRMKWVHGEAAGRKPRQAQPARLSRAPRPTGSLLVTPSGEAEPRRVLRHGDPFNVHLTLDRQQLPPVKEPADFTAALIAHTAGGEQTQRAGEGRGTLAPGQTDIKLDGRIVTPGTYWLEAELTFAGAGATFAKRVVRGDFIQVY